MFDASQGLMRMAQFPPHPHARRPSTGSLPAAAPRQNRTSVSGYGRPGVKVDFDDPLSKCNGCSLCVVQCPDGLIEFKADPGKGTLVYGARFTDLCKACRECVTACPLDLFREVAVPARPEGHAAEA
jgi:ferredoxin